MDKNYGLGIALSKGLKVCKNEIVARMDSDDISLKNRCEEQIKKIKSGYDLVGSWVDEFDDDCNFVSNIRTVPESYTEIKQFAKKRNPFNHPSVMFKKKAVISVGGYKDLLRLEDYYLWVRMIKNGNKMINIQKVLLHMRVNKDAYLRRNTYKSLESFFYLRNYQKRSQMISQSEKIILDFLQIILTLLPKKCLKFIYELVLRK